MRGRIKGLAVVSSAALLLAGGVTTAVVANAATAPVLLSRGKPVTASSTGGTQFAAKNAVDGNSATRWASAAGKDPSWIYVDLGATAHITRVRLQWDKSCAVSYRIETSADHATWTSIFSTTKGMGGVEDLTTLSGTGRYVRMFGIKRCRADATHGYSLQEFDVYGNLGGSGDKTPPTKPGTPVVSAVTSDSVTVHFGASTDNVGVTAYDILANGAVSGTVDGKTLTGTASGLASDTDYSITVVARDAAGNKSTASDPVTAHTAKGSGGGGNPYGDPHLVSMFDGKDLNGWTSSQSGLWAAQNGVIHGNGTARGWLYYNTNVGTFRWIFNVRQLPNTGKGHAPTVLIWGTNNPVRDALSAIQFQPPNGGHWDYRPGKNTGGGSEFKTFTHTKIDPKNWAQCEIIGNMSTGVARMACCPLPSASNTATCKGVEVLDFMDKTAGRVGLLALQVHNSGLHDEYKNLFVESPVVQSPGQFITG